jgi:hypothetical protein
MQPDGLLALNVLTPNTACRGMMPSGRPEQQVQSCGRTGDRESLQLYAKTKLRNCITLLRHIFLLFIIRM